MSVFLQLVLPFNLPALAGIRFLAGILALTSWLSITLQWSLMYSRSAYPIRQTLARFFGYFTILSNILVAFVFTAWFIYPCTSITSTVAAVFTTAICVYIIIVGAIYHLVLRKSFPLSGLDKLANALLHTWLPVCYVLFWFLLVPQGMLHMRLALYFLTLPLAYLSYILLLGHRTTHYPYPFINILEMGYPKVILNAFLIALGFVLVSAILIFLKS